MRRKFVRDGCQLIVNVTNDGWFNKSVAASQHFANARFRSIELRLPMVRSCNTGISAAVHPDGSIIGEIPPFKQTSAIFNVPLTPQPAHTLFTKWGNWFCPTALTSALIVLFWGRKKFLKLS